MWVIEKPSKKQILKSFSVISSLKVSEVCVSVCSALVFISIVACWVIQLNNEM